MYENLNCSWECISLNVLSTCTSLTKPNAIKPSLHYAPRTYGTAWPHVGSDQRLLRCVFLIVIAKAEAFFPLAFTHKCNIEAQWKVSFRALSSPQQLGENEKWEMRESRAGGKEGREGVDQTGLNQMWRDPSWTKVWNMSCILMLIWQ